MKEVLLPKTTVQKKTAMPPAANKSFPSFFLHPFTILRIVLTTGMAIFFLQVFAQPAGQNKSEAEYRKAVTERAAKIVNILGITDSGKYQEVLTDIINQYAQLNTIDEQNKTSLLEIKKLSSSKEEIDEAIKKEEDKKSSQLKQLHTAFIAHLQENLTSTQVESVKDGMTYRVCPITYAAYLDMLPSLTNEQKEKIYGWLVEARELAMDQGSSEKKHAVFGKYKGRINNYLSAQGYDMKKEGEAWQKRIREKEQAKKNAGN
jgi:hypothetical protein